MLLNKQYRFGIEVPKFSEEKWQIFDFIEHQEEVN
jgi:hypothetical protein